MRDLHVQVGTIDLEPISESEIMQMVKASLYKLRIERREDLKANGLIYQGTRLLELLIVNKELYRVQ